jgi:hypothetical protein
MSHYSSLGEVAVAAAEAENVEEITVSAELERVFGQNPASSDVERHTVSPNADDDLGEGILASAKPRMCCFGSSTITIGKIKGVEERGYFPEGEGRAPGTKTVPEPNGDEAVVYDDFFIAGLLMPPYPTLADFLLHFQAQLHQLMSNTIAQLSKNFWVVGSFGGMPSGNLFMKHYELHYQPKTVSTPDGDQISQYRYLNFHVKRDGGPKLSLAIKNAGRLGGQGRGFIAVCPASDAPEVAKAFTLFIHIWVSWITSLSPRWSVRIMILMMLSSSRRL